MDNTELKDLVEKQGQGVEALRIAYESNEKLSKEALDKIKEDFLDGEKANKDIQDKLEKQEKELEEQKELIKTMEKKFYRLPPGEDESEKKAAIKSFEKYIKEFPAKERQFTFDEMDRKYLRTDIATLGGVLVPEVLSSELLKQEIEVSPIQENSRIINSKVKSLTTAIRTTIPSVNRVGEGATSTKSNSQYKSVRLEAYKNDVIIPITREELNFATFNMQNEMTQDAALALTQQTNIDFLTGNGVSKSEGILVDAGVGSINSGIADDIVLDNFLEIQKKDNIKSIYKNNGKFYMNSNTIFDLAQRKGGDGQYLWTQNIGAGIPNQIAGKPYVDTPDMEDISAGNTPVFFGDLRRAYYILRR